jgi:RHS repeat-associated protein
MGRILVELECTPLNCSGGGSSKLVYAYDKLGDLTAHSNTTDNITFTNSYDAAARLTQIQRNFTDSQHPATQSFYYDLAYAPFGEAYNQFGTSAGSIFAGNTGDTMASTYDTPNREVNPNQGRWISPDPAGMGAVDITNPQSWNRYAYVLNNPLSFTDPSGLFCAYLNDAGDGVEEIDDDGDKGSCGGNGGYWISGSYGGGSWVNVNVNSGLPKLPTSLRASTACRLSRASSSTAAIRRSLMTTLGICQDSTRARKRNWRIWASSRSTSLDGVAAYAVGLGNPAGADPCHECPLDFFALGMGADLAVILVSTRADPGGFCLAVQLFPSWFVAFLFAHMM